MRFKVSEQKQMQHSHNYVTKVHFSEKGAYKYVTGTRQPISIRIDTGLYSRFKPLAKRVFGSVCRAVEIHMVTIIEAVENGVHFSNTVTPINIGKIVIERNLRPRRKLEVEGEGAVCGFNFCNKVAVSSGVYIAREKEFLLCEKHLLDAKNNSKQWKILDGPFSSMSEKGRETS